MDKYILDRPIVLVGMMGCGKSYIGKALANELDLPFHDSDSLIVSRQGKEISQIFDKDGEDYFRNIEREVISDLLDSKERCIISIGGGALTTPSTLENIKNHSISVWLYTDISTIYERVKNDTTRPLLQCDNPKAKLEGLLTEREHLYRQANVQVNNSGDLNFVVDEIKKQISLFSNSQIDLEEHC